MVNKMVEKCKHDSGWMVFSAEPMIKQRVYDPKKEILSTNYVKMACRKCGFIIYGAGSINFPEASDYALKKYPPKK